MPRLLAAYLGDIGCRSTSVGDSDGVGDTIQYQPFQDRRCFAHSICLTFPLPQCHYDNRFRNGCLWLQTTASHF